MRLLLLCMLVSCGCGSYMSDHRRLIDYLLRSNEGAYDTDARPVREQNTTMDISLELHLNAVMDVDVKKGLMTSSGWVGLSWFDEYTVWEPADFGGIRELRVPASMFWVPDVYLFNDASGEYHASVLNNDVKVWKSHDGTNHWYTPTQFRSLCDEVTPNAVNVSCPLVFGSWMYHENYINLVSEDFADLSNFNGNSKWHLLQVPATRHSKVYECCPEPYVDITWDVVLTKRHHGGDDDDDDDDLSREQGDDDEKNQNDNDRI